MTPKEKAEELIGKLSWFANDEYHELSEQWELNKNKMSNSKGSALIVVDEIFLILDKEGYNEDDYKIMYWQEVKTEIEKL